MRLIDADALLKKMKLLCVGDCSECDYNTFLSGDIHCGLIDEQPTIEAVPVEKIKRIVERLEKLKENAWDEEYQTMCDAVEIVKEELSTLDIYEYKCDLD